jgi:intracellular sulfur oxidation DsrE/DsrF family protein
MKQRTQGRRAMLSVMGAAAAGVALASSPARVTAQAGKFAPARHKEDEWFDLLPGKHRVFVDSASNKGGSDALLYATNLFTANKAGYGLEDGDIVTVVCFRHYSTIFGYNNAMWAKYGATIAKSSEYTMANGAEPTANPMRNIEALAKRGVQFAVCGMATRRVAGLIATASGGKTDEILKELTENLVPNGHLVAAGVVATTRAQEYGYSILVAG